MKRWIACIFGMVCILAAAGCGVKGEAAPPALTVKCGDQSVEARLGTYSWSSVESDSVSALFALEWMTPISRGGNESITLDFAVEPESVSIRCWSDQYANDANSYEANYTTLTCEDGTVEIPTDGSYIYEVKGRWEAGNACYSFYIID